MFTQELFEKHFKFHNKIVLYTKDLRWKGKYDAYLKTKGIKPYSYKAKDGSDREGFNFEYEMTFPERKGSK